MKKRVNIHNILVLGDMLSTYAMRAGVDEAYIEVQDAALKSCLRLADCFSQAAIVKFLKEKKYE